MVPLGEAEFKDLTRKSDASDVEIDLPQDDFNGEKKFCGERSFINLDKCELGVLESGFWGTAFILKFQPTKCFFGHCSLCGLYCTLRECSH